MQIKEDKNGQVTIFIIVAVVIIAIGVAAYFVYPKVKTTETFDSKNPSAFIQSCLESELRNNVELISSQGGSLNPGNYILYDNSKVEYLCYTNQDYQTCVMQQPLLKEHIESEIKNSIEVSAKDCFTSLVNSYEKIGENVNLEEGNTDVELIPKKIIVTFNKVLTLTDGNSERYENFKINLDNNLYELVSITDSILEWEARYGDADSSGYMDYYHWLKVEKEKRDDGSKIYILTDKDKGNKFQFASRSIVWPSGYGEVI
ncbi:MAG: hypothetical protein Q8P15_01175 [Nanoarchaeota archaeon]|nr:hypothetical protein [Nanoarchaeota archaeon]